MRRQTRENQPISGRGRPPGSRSEIFRRKRLTDATADDETKSTRREKKNYTKPNGGEKEAFFFFQSRHFALRRCCAIWHRCATTGSSRPADQTADHHHHQQHQQQHQENILLGTQSANAVKKTRYERGQTADQRGQATVRRRMRSAQTSRETNP